MMIKQVIALLLLLSVLTESTLSYYQDCWYAEMTSNEINLSEIDDLKESDTSFCLQSKDHHLSPRTIFLAEKKTTRFHFSETVPDGACASVASPPPEVC
ncbi:MAG: hypothetical protein ACKOCO_07510 [Bacteroidota bacterium]|jgi:hypothetical protein